MAMTRNFAPGVDPNWGPPQGGYITVGGARPGMGGTPNPLGPQSLRPNMPQQPNGAPASGAVKSGMFNGSPFGQFGVWHPKASMMMKQNFGL